MNHWALAVATALMLFGSGGSQASDEASTARGGRLYDDWGRETNSRPPSSVHPAFTAKGAVVASNTWRCSTCHGFDYKGKLGIVGIQARQGTDPAAIVKALKSPAHKYEGLLEDGDFNDLANFVSHGQVDMQAAIDSARKTKNVVASSERLYGTICLNCHGQDGARLREIFALGDTARERPSEVLHVILNGHPGGSMPALRLLGMEIPSRMLAYLQTLPAPNLSTSIAHGGRLYDNWQVESGQHRQAFAHPSYPRSADFANDPEITWRCKSCHGFDYLGNQGNYATGRYATGIKGIRAMAGADPAKIAAILRNSTHQYGAVLKERDLQDLANFVSAGQIDMDVSIDRQSRRARGNAARGAGFYDTVCAGCHGKDGKSITAPLGSLARANPWGALHTMLNGHPDEKMPALRELDLGYVIDALTYVQDLPDRR